MAYSRVVVELNIDGQGWTNVTGDVRTSDPIKITGGRRDESARVTPGTCTFKLNNKNGVYSDKNPLSPYFGKLGRNTPVRVWAWGDKPSLWIDSGAGQRARVASSPALDVTEDLDLRIELALDNIPTQSSTYSQKAMEIVGRYNTTGTPGNRSWRLLLNQYGNPVLTWSTNGDDFPQMIANLPVPYYAGQRFALRATLDIDNGAGGHTVTFYTAPSIDGPWTILGDPITEAGATSIHPPGDASLEVGDINTIGFTPGAGRYYALQLRDGIDGPLLADPDFTAQEPFAASFTDGVGNLWQMVGGAKIEPYYPRFVGEVSAWPQRWDVSGNDAWVPIQAAGVLRRMGQGTKALLSTLRRRIPDGGPDGQVPRAYWPMEEGRNATQAYSPLPGVEPLQTAGLNWAADDTLFGSDALPTLGQRASIYGRPGAGTPQMGGWTVDMSYLLDALPDSPQQMLRALIGGAQMATAKVLISTAGITMAIYDGDGALLASNTFSSNPSALAGFVGKWNRLQMFSGTYGGDTWVVAYWRDVITGVAYWSATFYSGGIGILTAVDTDFGDNLSGMAIGHLGIWGVGGTIVSANAADVQPSITYFDDADDGYESEYTLDRMRRLSAEEGMPLHITGDTVQTERVGPQRVDTILGLLQSAADVDGGLLHEQRDSLILAYRARHTLYNQTPALTLDYTARGEVMPPLEPTEDDQNTRNDVTVKRGGGSSARVVQDTGPLNVQDPPDGVGRYDTEVTLNAWADSQLPDLAGWRLHLGTWDGARYPSVHVALHAAPHLISQVLALGLLDRMQIVNPPRWVPPGVIDLLVEGYTETLGEFSWDIVFNCSPAGLWTVGETVPEDGDAGVDGANRADTSGCEVALDAAAADTVLVVRTPQDGDGAHARWVESAGPAALPGEFPFDVTVAGERVRVAGCEPRAWDLFDRTVAAGGWGTMGSGKVWNTTGGVDTDYSVDGDTGLITLSDPASNVRFGEYFEDLGDCELLACLSVDQTAAGGDLLAGLFARAAGSAFYWCDVAFQADGTLGVEVRSNTAVIGAREATPYSYGPGDRVWLRMRTVGDDRVLGRVWPDGTTEPGGWHIDRTIDAGVSSSGTLGIAAASTATNVAPVVSVHEFRLVDPQQMTVTRSVNGVTKDQAAGGDVRLTQPSIVAL